MGPGWHAAADYYYAAGVVAAAWAGLLVQDAVAERHGSRAEAWGDFAALAPVDSASVVSAAGWVGWVGRGDCLCLQG